MADPKRVEPQEEEMGEEPGEEAPAGSFLDTLQNRFGAAPWWIISLALHAILLLLMGLIIMSVEQDKTPETVVTTDLIKKEPPKYEEKKQVELFKSNVTIEHEVQIPNPIVTHLKYEIPDHFETEDDMDLNSARGDENAVSDLDMGGLGTVATFGVGSGGPSGPFGYRTGGGRRRAALRRGGSVASESAVDRALRWLARHQEPNGSWSIQRHEGRYNEEGHVAVTGLALLAFLGAGHTEKTGTWKEVVRKAVAYLVSQQNAEGMIGNNSGSGWNSGGGYNHSIAGLALAEAAGMARVPQTIAAAQKAIDWSVDKHQCGEGSEKSGWRYAPKMPPDMSVSGWFIMQLKSASVAGLKVDPSGFQGAIRWLDTVEVKGDAADPYSGHRYKYQPQRETVPYRTTSMGVLGRQFMGWRKEELQGAVEWMLGQKMPLWADADWYYWYYATLVCFQMGGDIFKRWNDGLRDMLVNHQVIGGEHDGSWPPSGDRYNRAGRAYSTAMGAMCLEVYYRYLPLYR